MPSQASPYHCLVMSNIMTTPLQFLYTSRNSASRAISDSACRRGTKPQKRAMTHNVSTHLLVKAEYVF